MTTAATTNMMAFMAVPPSGSASCTKVFVMSTKSFVDGSLGRPLMPLRGPSPQAASAGRGWLGEPGGVENQENAITPQPVMLTTAGGFVQTSRKDWINIAFLT